MTNRFDARIPIVLGTPDEVRPGDVLLAEGGHPHAAASFAVAVVAHAPGCQCCAPRTGAGRALTALLHGRALGHMPFFARVLAWVPSQAGRAELAHAVAHDPVASACFRLSPACVPARPDRPGPASAA